MILLANPASATRLQVRTDVTRAQITFQNGRYAVSGQAPFTTDLPAGRYELSIAVGGRRLGGYLVDVDGGVHLRGGRGTRTLSSAILPGSGQWRDDGWWSGVTVGGSMASLLGRAVYLNARAGNLREQFEGAGVPPSDGLVRIGHDLSVHEASRDDYLILAGAFYAGNVADALVRRGSIRFREAGPGVVTASYAPTGVGQTMLLSLLWPGLGQTRQGAIGRARLWNLAMLGTAFFWGEARNNVEKARSDLNFFRDTNSSSDTGYFETLARLESDVNDEEALARTAGYIGVVLWAYNIVDAALVTRRSVADSGDMVRNDTADEGWTLRAAPFGSGASAVLSRKF